MPLHFTCIHCGQETLVDDQYAGLTGPCATCGKIVTVPYFSQAAEGVAPTAAQPASGAEPLRVQRPGAGSTPLGARRRSVGAIILLIVAGFSAAGAVALLMFAILFPMLTKARTVAHRDRSAKNLEQIARALNSYAEQYSAFPPAYVADDNGQPMHSWRVLILPFLGEQSLYNQYDMRQPWDSQHNLALLPRMPEVYANPGDFQARLLSETSYLVVRGTKTAFPGRNAVSPEQLTDGLASTVLVVEVAETGIGWLEPVDLEYDRMMFEINRTASSEISSVFEGGAHVVTADGLSHFVPNDTPPEFVRALLSIAQGEYVSWDEIRSR